MAKSIFHQSIAGKYILIKIIAHDKISHVFFKVKFLAKMISLKKAYCDRMGLSEASIWMYYSGNLIKDEDTPEALNMKDMDVICVYEGQVF